MSQGLALTALSVLSLVAGVVLPRWLSQGAWPGLWQGLVIGAVGGLVALVVVPEALNEAGPPALLATLIGLGLPGVLERRGAKRSGLGANLTLGAALLALLLHTALDGVGLAAASRPGDSGMALAFAIIAHRFPVGLALWLVAVPRYGPRGAALVLVLVGATTFVGFFLGDALLAEFGNTEIQLFQAFVAGSLFHVLHHTPEAPRSGPMRASELLGAGLGICFVLLLPSAHPGETGGSDEHRRRLLELAVAIGPAMLIAWALAAATPLVSARLAPSRRLLRASLHELPSFVLSLALLGLELSLLRAFAGATLRRLSGSEETSTTPPRALIASVDRDTPWLLFGSILASVFDPGAWSAWFGGRSPYVDIVLFAGLGLALRVPAAGALPLAAAAVGAGLSSSAALAFATSGPTASATKLFGGNEKRQVLRAGLVLVASIAVGAIVETFFTHRARPITWPSWVAEPSVVLTTLVLLWSVVRQGPRTVLRAITRPELAHPR